MATTFVESCVETVADSAARVSRASRGKPKASKLVRLLREKRDILVTCHVHPDPDALGSALGMRALLKAKLPADAKVTISIKGKVGGGMNAAFGRFASMDVKPWDDERVEKYDAIVLLDTQPSFPYNPLPEGVRPLAVIDHHRSRGGRRPQCDFCDVRTDVGATASIVFGYFMELDVDLDPDLAAAMLYAIESDLAGAAGQPDELDTMAMSGLTLIADPRKLYRMRHVELPQPYFDAYADGMANAVGYGPAMVSHLDPIESLEMPAVIADFLLRYDAADWTLVSAVHENRLILSLRTKDPERSAGEAMRKVVRHLGQGGGHRTKAGGYVDLNTGSESELSKLRQRLRKRLLKALNIPDDTRGVRLIPRKTSRKTDPKPDAPPLAASQRTEPTPAKVSA